MPAKTKVTRNSRGKAKLNFLRRTVKRYPKIVPAIFVLLIASIGTYFILFSKAATVTLTTIEAETMSLPAGAASVDSDSTASNSSAVTILTKGTATGSFSTASAATSLTVRAKGIQCRGAPQMVVSVDGNPLPAVSVSSTSWADYTLSLNSLVAGSHSLSIDYPADYSWKRCDRSLSIDKTTIFGTVPDSVTTADGNLAANKPVTSSDGTATSLPRLTDSDLNTYNYANMAASSQWAQIDLGQTYSVSKVNLWHFFGDGRTYHDVIVQLSTTADFSSGNTTVYNNDTDNSSGKGAGADTEYAETPNGKSILLASAVNARYVRFWSNGSSVNGWNHYVEAQVYGSGGSTNATPTDPVPPPTTNGGSTLFEDQFNASAGTAPDSTKWIIHPEWCDANLNYACPKNSNVFHDGLGNMVIRVKREPSNYLGGGPFSGGWINNFNYGSGWPPSPIKASYTVPYRIEMRAKYPQTAGGWGGGWDGNVDRTTSQNIYELDWSEERTTYATRYDCHQHTWLSGRDIAAWDCAGVNISNMTQNWHTYAAEVRTSGVTYSVDGVVAGSAPGISGRFGTIINMGIGAPGSWGSAGGQPAASDPGPWDLLVDYIRVTAL